ncbi:MAG: hypothetical protein IPJ07_05630 [Acidobacteria bacterium]|nr:hypothetical protein [Acidobacteriota bacterium]
MPEILRQLPSIVLRETISTQSVGPFEVLTIKSVIDPANHHLFPGLITPSDNLSGIGVVFVIGRVVKMSHAIDAAALGTAMASLTK